MRHTQTIAILAATLLLAACGGGAPAADNAQAAQGQTAQTTASSSSVGCDRFFPDGKAPVIQDERRVEGTKRLCMLSFTLLHSSKTRTPLWVAEVVTKEGVEMGRSAPRIDDFHPEPQLDPKDRAELADYRSSGYDRGHMAPDADMPSLAASNQSFSLANMAPQKAGLNRKSWMELEKSIRRQTRGGPVYVLTGPLYVGTTLLTTHRDRRLPVPTHFFKAIYAKDRGAVVFIATNADRPHWSNMTVAQFLTVHRINAFPGMPAQFANVNGATEGSLDAKGGRNGRNGAGGSSIPDDALVRDPVTQQYITAKMYRDAHNRDPRPEDLDK